MSKINKILYATDLSVNAKEAMDWAKDIAAMNKAEITIIQNLPDVSKKIATFGADRTAPSINEERDNVIRSKKEEILRLCKERHKNQPDCKIDLDHVLVKLGQPVQEILKTADSGHFDMVIMGSYGQSLSGKLLLGSVAKGVVEQCKIPVLTVRLPSR